MAVKIRLSRFGKKKTPLYRIAVVDERKKRDGSVIEFVGQYDPKKGPGTVLKRERIGYWLAQGAQPTRVVSQILKRTKLEA